MIKVIKKGNSSAKRKPTQFGRLNFDEIDKRAKLFAAHIKKNFKKLTNILLEYESFEVVKDETERTLDLLNSLEENKEYFQIRVGSVAAFLPRNQPLYALSCFVIIPSLMAHEVHFRIPHSMKNFFPQLLETLEVNSFFPNIKISNKERVEFLIEQSALYVNSKTHDKWPVTDVVIFTGTSQHSERLRAIFDPKTLFIANGSGHNPIVISDDASLEDAVDATLSLQLYNQGQDCAAPNSILVHKKIIKEFTDALRKKLQTVQIGHYKNRSCRVGPISDPNELVRIQFLLVENRDYLDEKTPGIIRTKEVIVEPTIIRKPLTRGGNYSEVFAPLIFIQEYNSDEELALYFENPLYSKNAMYVSIYGKSKYIDSLTERVISGKILHDESTILHNTHLHAPGVERGTKPYGGYGYSASSLTINGKLICKPTLPQRDIYEWVQKPLKVESARKKKIKFLKSAKINVKNVDKLLKVKIPQLEKSDQLFHSKEFYIDTQLITMTKNRYILIGEKESFNLLEHKNINFLNSLSYPDQQMISKLHSFLKSNSNISKEEMQEFLYELPKQKGANTQRNKENQLRFFTNLYQLLFGKASGPRLPQFLLEANLRRILELIDV